MYNINNYTIKEKNNYNTKDIFKPKTNKNYFDSNTVLSSNDNSSVTSETNSDLEKMLVREGDNSWRSQKVIRGENIFYLVIVDGDRRYIEPLDLYNFKTIRKRRNDKYWKKSSPGNSPNKYCVVVNDNLEICFGVVKKSFSSRRKVD